VQNATARSPGAEHYRASLHRSRLAHVEDCSVPAGRTIPILGEPSHSIVLPYKGLFTYSIGRQRWLIDANRTLFVSPRQEYSECRPVGHGGQAVLIVTPSPELLDEICFACGTERSAAFMPPSRPSTMQLRLLTQQLLRFTADSDDPLHSDEWVVRTLHEAIRSPSHSSRRACQPVEHAKEVLHSRVGERVLLNEIAREVGVTPTYLTQQFTRREGVPLYQYFLRLRLTRALAELPHCDDIIQLAFELGFSSHSHFTKIFRETLGLTPSEYRSTIGTRQLRVEQQFDRQPGQMAFA